LVEAMMSARLPIVTDVGGNSEIVSDGEDGFIASAPTLAHLDDALERAWERRREWRAMGQKAAAKIRTIYTERPELEMVEAILDELKS
jgi:glycosyltransferase involved in cell wall biosynthesis